MRRRTFLQTVGAGSVASAISATEFPSYSSQEVALWTRQNDASVSRLLESQQKDPAKAGHGGFANAYGIFHVGSAAWSVMRFVCSLVNESSIHYGKESVKEALEIAMQFVAEQQHRDGTIDLVSTNFHSPPDTAFVVEPVALAYSTAKAKGDLPGFEKKAKVFLTNAARALQVGGIHTPNHRWVVCMALSRIQSNFPDPKNLKRIDEWLAEGIDIDSEGQYTEKSTSVYSPLVNRCLITMARILKRPELLEPVRKNLQMTRYFCRANGQIVTETSRRQDQYTARKMANYYYSYRYLANRDQNDEFAAMARMIWDSVAGENLAINLPYFWEDETFAKPVSKGGHVPSDYAKFYPESKVVRIRRGDTDSSILGGNTAIFTLHKKTLSLQALRMATAFFGKGQFESDTLIQQGKDFELTQTLTGPYYQPLQAAHRRKDGDWLKMPKHLRAQSEIQKLVAKWIVTEVEDGFQLLLDVQGCNGVPLAIEFGFGSAQDNRKWIGCKELKPNTLLADNRKFSCQNDREKISVEVLEELAKPATGPICKHAWTELRGAQPQLAGQSVYITDFTPLRIRLKIG